MVNIQRWPVEKKLQLPDWCFGRRYLVTCTVKAKQGAHGWDISEVAMPEACVVWEYCARYDGDPDTTGYFWLALGDQLPVTQAIFRALDPMFMGLGVQGPDPRMIRMSGTSGVHYDRLRIPVATMGRRLVLMVEGQETGFGTVEVGLVVSGMPKEVPEWVISG